MIIENDTVLAGRDLWYIGRYTEALAYFQRALDENPLDVAARRWWGNTAFNLGRVEEAIKQLKTAIELKPSYIHTSLDLATLYCELKKNDLAVEVLKAALKSMTTDFERYWVEGYLHNTQGDNRAAIASLTRAYDIFQENYNVTSLLGELLVSVGENEKGRDVLNVALTLNWVPPSVYRFLGIAESRLGNEDRALALLEQGAQADPGNIYLREELVKRYLRKGMPDKASKHISPTTTSGRY